MIVKFLAAEPGSTSSRNRFVISESFSPKYCRILINLVFRNFSEFLRNLAEPYSFARFLPTDTKL